ncbi:3-isopropylmalate dehydratase small subunit [Haliea sp. AH-315-K21]|uniref:3-isopropylmalate dehydratase small subunit n=1 Tax=SAR86 cluster bacterium TaxID=2030880 RepID=A0A2A5CFJ6_9GAMM|nr:3-isopropylmalate dehydratase small subunit [Haliea sp. AH-315-K21]MBN4075196.1 3-isopropylmalate dehydratase small subunit [Gammaproteobacteria bacterium AH-315-E17]PCJ42146.1 MAG: 3-isopropylmalate dehydratase small subunit [SAR86 cluster bacterium]
MRKFSNEQGIVIPLDRANVDTDYIIPKQFLKSIKRTGFGKNLFDEARYLDKGLPDEDCSNRPLNTDFVLNQQRYQGGNILLSRENFGCGSSREHAPWALDDYGIHCIIAPSYADIFFNNCFKNGILPVVLKEEIVEVLFQEVFENEGYELEVDLLAQSITKPDGSVIAFNIEEARKNVLLNGLDDISMTLQHADDINAFETRWQQESPWLFS